MNNIRKSFKNHHNLNFCYSCRMSVIFSNMNAFMCLVIRSDLVKHSCGNVKTIVRLVLKKLLQKHGSFVVTSVV